MMSDNAALASVSYTIIGGSYTQNFDSLPNTPTNVSLGNSTIGWKDDDPAASGSNFSIEGWYLWHPINLSSGEGGFNGNQRMRIGAGTVNTGAFMSFGAAASTEALGGVMSNTLGLANSESYMGLRLTNNTGSTLGQFTLSYNGEQWRNGGNSPGSPSP